MMVQTDFGNGIIVGKDLPSSDHWRYKVKMTEPNEKGKKWITAFKTDIMCFNKTEVKKLIKE